MRVAALLLLVGLLAPSGVSAGPAAAPGNLSSRGVMIGDNSVFLPRDVRVSERLFGLPGLTNVGRVANGIFRGAQPKPEGYATLKAMGVRTVINLRSRHGEREAVEAAGMREEAIAPVPPALSFSKARGRIHSKHLSGPSTPYPYFTMISKRTLMFDFAAFELISEGIGSYVSGLCSPYPILVNLPGAMPPSLTR